MTCDVLHVVGARPNFAKMGPVFSELKNLRTKQAILHSGQHYDSNMSDSFFRDLEIPPPDIVLTSFGSNFKEVISDIENSIVSLDPKLVCVYGDINTTLLASIATKKAGKLLAHVESGLRSGDKKMPEEVNRIMVDAIADIHFVTESSGVENLKTEGKTDSVFFVGNTMIDSLSKELEKIEHKDTSPYYVVTFHRPSNVDSKESLLKVLDILSELKEETFWPIHPRSLSALKKFRLLTKAKRIKNLKIIDPMSYKEFIKLVRFSNCVITDSGGIQEETTFMRVPCLTYRENTERPSTVDVGTNTLFSTKNEMIKILEDIKSGVYKKGKIPPLWDGKSGQRIAISIKKKLLTI